jgi:D-hexose-6-phosphate mutarotase
MNSLELQALNERFAIAGQLTFKAGSGGLPMAVIGNSHGRATVSLLGGQVLSYQPVGHGEVLWVSRQSKYEPGKAIRGGVPICWPWFGDHPMDPKKPAHGFVRTMVWKVLDASVVDQTQTRVRLGLSDDDRTRAVWAHAFDLTVAVTVGPELTVELTGVNQGEEEVVCGGALHSYFTVAEVSGIAILGLEGRTYIDKVDSLKRKVQRGPVQITGPTDWVFLDTTTDCVIEDPGLARRVRVAKSGSRTTVVWNPWKEKAAAMADFGDQAYHTMVCVEAANAAEDVVAVGPGCVHRLGTRIGVEHGGVTVR